MCITTWWTSLVFITCIIFYDLFCNSKHDFMKLKDLKNSWENQKLHKRKLGSKWLVELSDDIINAWVLAGVQTPFFFVCNVLRGEIPSLLGGWNMASNIKSKEMRICYTHWTPLISEIVHDFCLCAHERLCMACKLCRSVQGSFSTFIRPDKALKDANHIHRLCWWRY